MLARRSPFVLILVILCSMLLPGCSVNPLLQDAGAVGPSVFEGISDAKPVTATAPDGTILHGAYVAASIDAPVVLHLLPSGASVETGISVGIGRTGLAASLESLREQGFSSVVFDYRGVGGSEGSRSARLLRSDGKAMWEEAVRLAGGREDRVVIRAGSLGSLVTADLLAGGAEPAGVILFAPVRSSSVVRHAIAAHRGALLAILTSGLYRSPGSPNLEDVAGDGSIPMLFVLPAEDEYLPADEARVIADAARAAGHAAVEFPGDHQTTILRSWNFEIDADGQGGRKVETLWDTEVRFLEGVSRGTANGTAIDRPR